MACSSTFASAGDVWPRLAEMDRLILSGGDRTRLDAALLPAGEDEHLAVGFATVHRSLSGRRLLLRDVLVASPGDYRYQSPIHLEMEPAYCARVANPSR